MSKSELGKPNGTGSDRNGRQALEFELPDLPNETNFLSHQATQWVETSEAILLAKGLLDVANGGIPLAAKNIIDTPVSVVPPRDGHMSRKDDQERLNIQANNERNRLKREDLTLTAWTSVYVAVLFAAEKNCPILYENLKSSCDMTVHDPSWGEFKDGPLAWRMVLHMLLGKRRTKKDRDFYKAALGVQQKTHLADGAPAEEYAKRARAFIKYINPHLPQPYVGGDISEYLIEMMPTCLRESGRRAPIQWVAVRTKPCRG